MAVAELHFFDKDDPNGSTIFECSTDDQFLKQVKLDIQRDSLGNGHVDFARKVPAGGLFTRDIVVPEALVRILVPEIDATHYLWGFFINPRQQQVVSRDEQGGEGFSFAGPGPKHYLERMVLWSSSFSGFDNAVEKDSGIWTWPSTARAGVILDRLLQEEQDNPHRRYLTDLTQSFGSVNDSAGVPWADDIAGDEDFTLNIGDDYLKILWQIEDASQMTTRINLGTVSNPLLQLDAYQTFGRDLTGPIGSGTVHFTEGVNIATDLDVEGSSYAKASDALVKGNDGIYHFATNPGYTPGDLRKVVFTKYSSANTATLERAGERYLRRQDNGEKQIDLRIVPGFDDTTGLYMPSPETFGSGYFWVGDTVSLTTGIPPNQTELDYDDEPQAVTGIQMELEDAVRDDDAESAARSWLLEVQLNHERKSSGTSRDLAGNRGSVQPVPATYKLCRLPTEATGAVQRLYFSSTGAGFSPAADAGWETVSAGTVRILTGTPDDSLAASHQSTTSASGNGDDICLWRGLYGPLSSDAAAAFAAGGVVVQAQVRARMRYGVGISESSQNGISQINCRITTGASTTIRGTALALHNLASSAGSEKWKAQSTKVNRVFPPDAAPTNVTSAVAGTAAGDYVLFELGLRNFTTVTTGATIACTSDNDLDLPEDELTTDPFNSWIAFSSTSDDGSLGDLPADTVAQGFENAGTSTRVSRCDHQHAHGLLSVDGLHYHEVTQTSGALQNVDPALAPADGDVLTWDETAGLWVADTGGGGAIALDDLTDVVLTAPALDDDLRYDGSMWVNDPRKWEAVTNGEDVFVWESDDLVHEWNA